MSLAQMLLPEFDQETANARKLLELTPADKAAWKPHEKSMSLGRLAVHLAEIPTWATVTLTTSELDLNPPGGPEYKPTPFSSKEETLRMFDENVKKARESLAAATDANMGEPWTLKGGGVSYFTLPKGAVLRSFVFSHLIHHRAQFQLYLRLHNIPVPGMYGPSADYPM